ncbi:hypothetical protein G6F59_014336 [Rhizopus arrhizus]|nr:hypothetical protein G6F59_014336 [Rhizopus arrhizus]
MGHLAFATGLADGNGVVAVRLGARAESDAVAAVGGGIGTECSGAAASRPRIPADGGGVVFGGPRTCAECRGASTAGTRRDQAEEGAAANGDALLATGFAGLAHGHRTGTGRGRAEADRRGVGTTGRRSIAERADAALRKPLASACVPLALDSVPVAVL